jgi:molecular chaperone DnaJ
MASKRCYYEVLGVEQGADDNTIKVAYKKLAWEYHPDRNAGDDAAETKFKEASEAYEVLRDPEKRRIYDRYGHAGLESRGASPHFDDINSIFGVFGNLFDELLGRGRGRGRRGAQPGRDIQLNLTISLLDAFQGGTRKVSLPRREPCGTCAGSGMKPGTSPTKCRRCEGRGVVIQGQSFFRMQTECTACRGRGMQITDPCKECAGEGSIEREEEVEITIPRGVDDGMTMRVTGQGETGDPGAEAGDLYVVFQIEPDPRFVRREHDLHIEVPISFSAAALGGKIEVPTIDGDPHPVELPRGSQSGEEIRLRGLGMPELERTPRRSARRGDLVVHLRVVTPRKLTKRQEELLRELQQLEQP